MLPTTTIPTTFLVVSDTHGLEMDEQHAHAHPFRLPLPKADVLLHCGDLTEVGGHGPFRKALNMMASIDAELKLVIAGNHDLELDGDCWPGVTYLEEGTHTFTLKNGATFTIYTSPYTSAFGDWAFGYPPSRDRFNGDAKNAVPEQVNVIMTHGPPKGILDLCPQGHVGCENVLEALKRARPLMHCFGHIHEGHGAQLITWNGHEIEKDDAVSGGDERWSVKDMTGMEKGQTLAVNAAIQGDGGQFCNPPWLVTLPLTRK